jgi:hypothetical protein
MKKEGLGLGIFFILLGSLWLLGNLGFINFSIYDLGMYIRRILELWPLILIVIGTNMVTDNRFIRSAVLIISAVIVLAYIFIDPVSLRSLY